MCPTKRLTGSLRRKGGDTHAGGEYGRGPQHRADRRPAGRPCSCRRCRPEGGGCAGGCGENHRGGEAEGEGEGEGGGGLQGAEAAGWRRRRRAPEGEAGVHGGRALRGLEGGGRTDAFLWDTFVAA